MTPTPEMIEAAALALANYESAMMDIPQIASVDEFRFDSDRNDYLKRSELILKAALVAMRRPIEEAPKDGTSVLLLIPARRSNSDRIERGYFCDDRYSKKPRPFWNNSADNRRVSDARVNQPTQFIPLSIFEDRK